MLQSGAFSTAALDSALAQDYRALEVIVVNDGSTDDFETTVAPYSGNPRVKILTQPNRGPAAARNLGIAHAGGQWIKFLDADDWLAANAVSEMMAIFARDPALGLVYCDFTRVDAQGNVLDDFSIARSRRVLDGDILPSLLVGGYFSPHTVLVPRTVLDRVGGFDETLPPSEDYEMWMRIASEGYRAQFIPQKLAYYRVHGSNSSGNTARVLETQRRALDLITTRYPHRVAAALDELIREHQRVDRDSEWARQVVTTQQAQIEALQRGLNTRGVRVVRAMERWWSKAK